MDSTQTIKSLLNADFTQLSASSMRDFESTDNIQQLRRSLQENVPDHQWDIIRQQLLTQVEQLLDIPLHPILVKSWLTHDAVKREIERQQKNNANHEEGIVVLDSHEIRSTHSPTLMTKVGQETINLRFFIGIVLQLNHISLKIQRGDVKAILAGVMSGNGFMQHQNITLIEADFLRIKLASDIDDKNKRLSNNESVTSPVNDKEATRNIAPETPDITPNDTVEITTENRDKKQPPSTFKRNITQFILGVIIAVVALVMLWQMIV